MKCCVDDDTTLLSINSDSVDRSEKNVCGYVRKLNRVKIKRGKMGSDLETGLKSLIKCTSIVV